MLIFSNKFPLHNPSIEKNNRIQLNRNLPNFKKVHFKNL
jgi:hypothetical protein